MLDSTNVCKNIAYRNLLTKTSSHMNKFLKAKEPLLGTTKLQETSEIVEIGLPCTSQLGLQISNFEISQHSNVLYYSYNRFKLKSNDR